MSAVQTESRADDSPARVRRTELIRCSESSGARLVLHNGEVHLTIILDMAADGFTERPAFTDSAETITYGELRTGAAAVAAELLAVDDGDQARTVFLGSNSIAVPLTLFASAVAGRAFTPLNYRLTDIELRRIAERAAPAVAIVDDELVHRLTGIDGLQIVPTSQVVAISRAANANAGGGALSAEAEPDPDAIGVLLFTSGTTGEPKAAVLRHTHLASYVMTTLDYASSADDEVALVSVPPYHIAGISAIVSSVYTGRHVAYLANFTPEGWVAAVADHKVTHAMVVPTMLSRVLDVIEQTGAGLDHLRHLSYGGGRMPLEQIGRALDALPHTNFVNAYGLTETSSTISVLGPDDHRLAHTSDDPAVRRRLGSVGRPSEAVEISIRDEDGAEVPVGTTGEIWVRGEQVSGEYVGRQQHRDEGWFHTNDGGSFDADGFLYVEGRLDDVIVRGGENISPGEVEDVLREHPSVADVAVIGLPSQEWGERIIAVVVARADTEIDTAVLQQFVRERLRSSRSPEAIHVRSELPYSETGKLLRRVLRAELG